MSINMKEIEFSSASYDQWQEEAVKALKGKPFESLFTKTIENITLQPLYTEQSVIEQLGEQLEKQVATIRSLSAKDGFEVAQQIVGDTEEQFIANLEDSLARGNEVITIHSPLAFDLSNAFIEKIADYFAEYTFKLTVEKEDAAILAVFDAIDEAKRSSVEGYIIADVAIELSEYSKVRNISANTIKAHNEGADSVQELAVALAQASKYAKQAPSFEAFAQKFFVQFAIDTQFFPEVAKLRAFKVLWKAFTSAFTSETVAVPVVAETSVRSFSKLDVYVNLLRAGNEAFAAAIGGVDVLTVHPHDALAKPTEQSTRIARNVSLVIKEESHVQNVIDPSGGSYFVETLTAQYVEAAWALFLQIEEAGGIDAYADTLQASIADVYAARVKAAQTRKQSLIGTNIYANPTDALPTEENAQFADVKRLAIPFEQLRTQFASLSGDIGVLTFGELKNFKPRADFVAGFFATAGIVTENSDAIQTIEEAQAWLQATSYKYVVIAATDEDTKALVPALLDVKPANIVLDAAGRYKEEQDAWQQAGLNGFIFAGQNIIEKLNAVASSVKED